MNLNKYQFNLEKYSSLKSNESREMVRNMFDQMIMFNNDAHNMGAANPSTTTHYQTAQLLFNTLMNNGYLISERERKLGQILD